MAGSGGTTATELPAIRSRDLRWPWQGNAIGVGIDELGEGPAVLVLPALDAARRVNVPLMVAYGAETPPKSRAEMEALAALPGVETFVARRGKLAFYEEFAAELAPVVARFLRQTTHAGAIPG